MLLPFAYMVGIAFTPNAYILQTPPTFIPVHPTLDNFISAWNDNDFGQAFLNSIISAGDSVFVDAMCSRVGIERAFESSPSGEP